jgi:tRNA/rRNA methyltransferase/tRNA (cytidine32/uridine32-2'-O)-methyltransferase
MSVLDAVRVVLYEPQDPINIGATVRAMKNMGVRHLRLVRPVDYEPNRIEQVAHNTRDIVALIEHHDTLDAALADCVRVAAFSARRRGAKWDRVAPRAMAEDLLGWADGGPVAVLFGREDHGLPADAIDRAQLLVTVPTTEHASLNLAQAVLLALYELHLAAGDATVGRTGGRHRHHAPPPTAELWEHYFRDTERALEAIDFFKTRNPEYVMRSVRSLAFRAQPDARELTLVRSMAIEVLRTIDRVERNATAAALARGAAGAAESSPSVQGER